MRPPFDPIVPQIDRVHIAFATGAATHGSPELDPRSMLFGLAFVAAMLTWIVLSGAAR